MPPERGEQDAQQQHHDAREADQRAIRDAGDLAAQSCLQRLDLAREPRLDVCGSALVATLSWIASMITEAMRSETVRLHASALTHRLLA